MTATAPVGACPDALGGLLADNCHFLDQLASFIAGCDGATYARCRGPFGGNGIGRQVRHLLDHVQAVLEVGSGEIDYDRRTRDPRVETSPQAALETLDVLGQRLIREGLEWRGDMPIWVAGRQGTDDAASSTWQRELMFLASHTVHHMALIALLAEREGIATDPGFGVAPSTLRYWQQQPPELDRPAPPSG